jgi:hypothetical protein
LPGQDDVDLRVPVVDRQHDGHDAHAGEVGVRHVIAQERAKLFQNETLYTQVPVAGTLFISSHDARLRGGREAAKETSRSAGGGRVTRSVGDEAR